MMRVVHHEDDEQVTRPNCAEVEWEGEEADDDDTLARAMLVSGCGHARYSSTLNDE